MSFRKWASGHCLVVNLAPAPVFRPMFGRPCGDALGLEEGGGLGLGRLGQDEDVVVVPVLELGGLEDHLLVGLLVDLGT